MGLPFSPIETLDIPKGKVVNLTIDEDDVLSPGIAKKLAQLTAINGSFESLNETEPLPSGFDEILAQRVNFSRDIDL
jgi:hypothetical protein